MRKTAGDILKEARDQKELSLRDVAAACGVSISTLSRIENGEMGEFVNVAKFANVVGVDMNELGAAVVEGSSTYRMEYQRDGWRAFV